VSAAIGTPGRFASDKPTEADRKITSEPDRSSCEKSPAFALHVEVAKNYRLYSQSNLLSCFSHHVLMYTCGISR
jgi:hypothetical protein